MGTYSEEINDNILEIEYDFYYAPSTYEQPDETLSSLIQIKCTIECQIMLWDYEKEKFITNGKMKVDKQTKKEILGYVVMYLGIVAMTTSIIYNLIYNI